MEMYICRDCRAAFAAEEAGSLEHFIEFEGRNYPDGSSAICPECGSKDIEEGYKCPICGEAFFEAETIPGSTICKECYTKALTKENILKYLEKHELFMTLVLDWLISVHEYESFFKEALLRFLLDDKIKSAADASNPCTYFMDKVKEFIDGDAGHFSEWYEETFKKKEVK